ncbi:MAG TPA: YhdP family protein [Pseudomonadales bacterium]|jgi:uncharacterized protein (TIGR02099 family)|nr:YhdP family protein [Pseudomonadales bacterium]HNV53681.1 YhdP family protein [Pseudomonadales bacterium]
MTPWRLITLALQALLWLGFALLLGAAVVVGVGRNLLPRVDEFQSQLSAEANRRCQCRITFTQITGDWEGLAPVIRLQGLEIETANWSLRGDAVEFSLHLLQSLWHRQPRLVALSARGVTLSVDAGAGGRARPLDALLVPLGLPERLQLHDVTLLWQDAAATSTVPPLLLPQLDLEQAAAGYRIAADFKLDATAPVTTAILHLHGFDGSSLPSTGEFHLRLPQQPIDARWLRLLGGFEPPAHLTATAELWGDLEGLQLVGLTGEISAAVAPTATAASADAPVIQLGFHYQHESSATPTASLARPAWRLELEPRLLLPNEAPRTTHLHLIGAGAPDQAAIELFADRIDLRPWRSWLIGSNLLPSAWQQRLEQLAPTGQIEALHLLAPRLTTDAFDDLELSARLTTFSMQAWQGAPAVSGVDGTLFIRGGHGLLQFDSKQLDLHFPKLFAQSWRIDTAQGTLFWQVTPELIEIDSDRIQLGSDRIQLGSDRFGAQGVFRLLLPRHDLDAATLGLSIGINPASLLEKDQFLPTLTENARLIDWIRQSLTTGLLEQGSVVYQGRLHGPEQGKRTLLFFRGRDMRLRFQPDWPILEELAGSVWVSDADLDIEVTKGKSGNLALTQGKVVGRRSDRDPHYHLSIESDLTSTLAESKKWVLTTPLRQELLPWLGELELHGPLQGRLKLDVPLGEKPKIGYQLDLRTNNGRVAAPRYRLRYDQVEGALRLATDQAVHADQIKARFLGQPVTVRLQQSSDPTGHTTLLLTQEGRVDVADLTDWLDLQPLDFFQGEAPYVAQLQLPLTGGNGSELTFESNLVGLGSSLPPPLSKAPQQAVPLFLLTRFNSAGLESLSLLLNEEIGFDLTFDAAGRDRGQILLGSSQSARPLSAHNPLRGNLPPIDLDQWIAFYRAHLAHIDGIEKSVDWFTDVGKIDFTLPQLRFLGQALNEVHLTISQQQERVDLRVASDKVRGTLQLALDHSAPIRIALEQLTLTTASNRPDNDPLANFDPATLPSLDFQAAAIHIDEQPLGSWAFQLRPTAQGITAQQINATIDGFTLRNALMVWQRDTGGLHRSQLTSTLEGGDIAQLARYFGVVPGISSQSARIDVNLAWPGSPAHFALERTRGDYRLLFRNGRFETGGGTSPLGLFSLFNFNNLISKLQLNLSDFGGGSIGYQQVDGRMKLANNVLTLDDRINIESAVGRFKLAGTIDLASQNLDLDMAMTLPIGTNLPWYVAAIGGLPTAAAAYLAGQLFEKPLAQLTSTRYQVTGPINDPKITLVELFQDQPTRNR